MYANAGSSLELFLSTVPVYRAKEVHEDHSYATWYNSDQSIHFYPAVTHI